MEGNVDDFNNNGNVDDFNNNETVAITPSKPNKLLQHTSNRKKKSVFKLTDTSLHTFLREAPVQTSLELLKNKERKEGSVLVHMSRLHSTFFIYS